MSILIVVVLFVLPVILWKKVYIKPITCCVVSFDNNVSYRLEAIKPNRKWFKSLSFGKGIGNVVVGYKHVAFYLNCCDLNVKNRDTFVPGVCYIFQVGFLGRLKSVDISSRAYQDVISKFN